MGGGYDVGNRQSQPFNLKALGACDVTVYLDAASETDTLIKDTCFALGFRRMQTLIFRRIT